MFMRNQTILGPCSWTSGLMNWEKMHLCYLSHRVNVILLWQPQQTKTTIFKSILQIDPRVRSLGWEYPLEKELTTHFSVLAWKIPWMEERGMLPSIGWQRVRHDWVTNTLKIECELTISFRELSKNIRQCGIGLVIKVTYNFLWILHISVTLNCFLILHDMAVHTPSSDWLYLTPLFCYYEYCTIRSLMYFHLWNSVKISMCHVLEYGIVGL